MKVLQLRKTAAMAALLAIVSFTGGSAGAAEPNRLAINSLLEKGIEFRNIGPWRGGRVTAVAGVEQQPYLFYMGAAGGGLWKTTNGGRDWHPIADNFFATGSIGAIDVADSDPDILYVGTGESPYRGVGSSRGSGVYKSRDGGKSWRHVGLAESFQISAIVIHPENPDVVWAGVQGHTWAPSTVRGVYKSVDGGNAWDRRLFVDETTGVADLRIDPKNPDLMYATTWDHLRKPWEIRSGGPGSGIWKSIDGGENWVRIGKGLPSQMGKIGIAPSVGRSGQVWAIVESGERGGLYRSDDGGETWSLINTDRRLQSRAWYYMHIFTDPENADTVYVLNRSFLKSTDAGLNFEVVRTTHADHHDLWINPGNAEVMIEGNDGGAAVTVDGGKTWSSLDNQPTAQIYRVAVDNDFPYRVYGSQQDSSTISIPSRANGTGIGTGEYFSVGGCESSDIDLFPENSQLIYATCALGGATEFDRTTNMLRDIRVDAVFGMGIEAKDRRYRFNWNAPIVASKHQASVLYHAGNSLFKSTDRGQSWTKISPDLTRDEKSKQGAGGRPFTNEISEHYNTLLELSESPHESGVLWAGADDGLIHLTRDDGKSWERFDLPALRAAQVFSIAPSPHEPGTAFVAASRHKNGNYEPIVYKVANYGESWTRIDGDLPEDNSVRVVREDTSIAGLLYVGTESGIYVSVNEGKDWQALKLNLPSVTVSDIRLHDSDLIVATMGRGIWILDELSTLRELVQTRPDAGIQLFSPAVAFRVQTLGGSGPGQNPPSGAIIDYLLDESFVESEKPVRIDILDSAGDVIRSLRSGQNVQAHSRLPGSLYRIPRHRGLNRAVWDLRIDYLTPPDGVFAITGFEDNHVDGYRVMPGEYRVRLIAGEQILERALEVRWDPRVKIDAGHAASQQRLLADAYEMLVDLYRSLDEIQSLAEELGNLRNRQCTNAVKPAICAAVEDSLEQIGFWTDEVTNSAIETFDDAVSLAGGLDARLMWFIVFLDGHTPPATDAHSEQIQILGERYRATLKRGDELRRVALQQLREESGGIADNGESL